MLDQNAISDLRQSLRERPVWALAGVLCVAMTAFHVYYAATLKPTFFVFYPIHLSFALSIVYLDSLSERSSEVPSLRKTALILVDLALLGVAIAALGYLIYNSEYVINRMMYFDRLTPLEVFLASGLTVAVLEATRRSVGMVLVVICILFLLYAMFGNLVPGLFRHSGVKYTQILEMLYMSPDGFFNSPLKVAADFVFLFVVLGALLLASGAGGFFTDLAFAVAGRAVGGPAKAAICSSALMGMLQGSSNGNVATTGPFTIPVMERYGYRKEYAAGVEAVASTGGMLTPPIMGAAAFLMSEITGIPYVEIIIAALIPAVLYFLAVGFMVDLEARRLGLKRVAAGGPTALSILMTRGYLLAPILVMIWFLMDGYSPARAGFAGIVALASLLVFDAKTRRRYLSIVLEAALKAPRMVIPVIAACASAGLIAGIIIRTGLNLKLGMIVLNYAQYGEYIVFMDNGVLFMGLVLTMIIAIIMGMGVPTTAAYIVLAALLGPGLANMGASVMAAHLFIIYAASKSAITPPVAVASYTAAAVAGSDPWRTSLIAFRLGLSVFVLPFIFVFSPGLLFDGTPQQIVWSTITATFGIFALSVGSAGWLKVKLNVLERIISVFAAIPMIYGGMMTDLFGLSLFSAAMLLAYLRTRIVSPRADIGERSADAIPERAATRGPTE
jgi:TRAP transporter 4TM/12TM fusion protein